MVPLGWDADTLKPHAGVARDGEIVYLLESRSRYDHNLLVSHDEPTSSGP